MINKLTNISFGNFQNLRRNRLFFALPKLKAAIAIAFLTSVVSACESENEPGAVISPAPEVAATPVVTPTVIVTATPTVTPTVVVTAKPTVTPTVVIIATPTATPTVTVTATPKAGLPNAKLIGENVTVSTKVQRVITPNLFTVYDKESLGGQEVLVVSKQQAPPVGTNIELTGVVRNFVVADVNKNYNLNLSPTTVQAYVNKPYVDAKAIEKVD
ncbi:hypothetical protein NIES4071_08270 [Calothrix sp. NIES-4071]|nr:hypothetical protein NIES4071_08270 [Calothrix sp. NIES-4071]BAZ55169.1 hypothetical protein NIES4105_08230 [Calothrix sp. NIES-4105]